MSLPAFYSLRAAFSACSRSSRSLCCACSAKYRACSRFWSGVRSSSGAGVPAGRASMASAYPSVISAENAKAPAMASRGIIHAESIVRRWQASCCSKMRASAKQVARFSAVRARSSSGVACAPAVEIKVAIARLAKRNSANTPIWVRFIGWNLLSIANLAIGAPFVMRKTSLTQGALPCT